MSILANPLPDYISLWKTRWLMDLSRQTQKASVSLLLFVVDCILSLGFAMCAVALGELVFLVALWAGLSATGLPDMSTLLILVLDAFILFVTKVLAFLAMVLWFIPAFVGRLWFLLYICAGLILQFARRVDVGFAWFNSRFDVENHPLQCIGLVAGTLCALGYWILVGIRVIP